MKLYATTKIPWIWAAVLFLLSACNLPQAQPAPDLDTVVSQTQTAMAVNLYLTATAFQPTNTPESIVPTTEVPTAEPGQPILTTTAEPQQNPTSTLVSQPTCTNMAKFEGETIPDNSAFAPGQEFIKTWTLRNVGSCAWNPEYALVFIRGDQMSGTSPSPIGQNVPPGETIRLFLPQKAPQTAGEHQGFWKLRSTEGQDFGLGTDAQTAFWVKINVVPGANPVQNQPPVLNPQNPASPSWVVSFDSRSPFFLGTDSGMDYDVKNGELTITAIEPMGDQWRVAQGTWLDNFYLQADFRTGANCTGKDGYGLIVRAPDKPSGIINSGIVFSFSCDGKYRVYRMDNGNFTSIQNWTNHPLLKSGPNQPNTMGIYAVDSNLQLYINNALAFEFNDNTYLGGLYGLVIRSEATRNFQTSVSEIAAWIDQ